MLRRDRERPRRHRLPSLGDAVWGRRGRLKGSSTTRSRSVGAPQRAEGRARQPASSWVKASRTRHPGALMTRPFRLAALALASTLVLAACGSSGSSGTSSTTTSTTATSSPRPASVVATKTSSLGTFLVDAKGRALYLWNADHGAKSVCSGACAQAWPPLTTDDHAQGERCGQGLAARHDEARRRLARGHLRRAPALLLRRRQHARPDHRPGQQQLRLAVVGRRARPARRSRTRWLVPTT